MLVVDSLVGVYQNRQIYWDYYQSPSLGFTETGPKMKENNQRNAVVWMMMPFDMTHQRMGRLFPDERKTNYSNNHSLQPRNVEHHL